MIYIVGGSNSIRKNGWSFAFADLHENTKEICNLAIGGTGSLTGAWRTLFTCDLQPDDIVIWEYALNDSMLINAKSYPDEVCLRFCEYVIRHVHNCGARMIPLLLTNLPNELRPNTTRYRRKLERMFMQYGIEFVDVAVEARRELGFERLTRAHYEDLQHYVPGGPVIQLAARRAKELVDAGAGRPKYLRRPRYNEFDVTPRFHSKIPGVKMELFDNRLMSISANPLIKAPFSLEPFGYGGRLSHIIFVSPPSGGAVRVAVGDRSVALSLTAIEGRVATAVRAIGLAGLFDDAQILFSKDDVLQFENVQSDDQLVAEAGFTTELSEQDRATSSFQLVGVMTEPRIG